MNAVSSTSIYRHWSLLFVVIVLFSGRGLLHAQPDNADVDFQKIELHSLLGINTANLEYAPTVTADGHTLYFVSDRPGGEGGHDMWTGYIKDRRDTSVTSVRNLGNSINTPFNEGTVSISADGLTMYFVACNRRDGVGDCDIYEARLIGNNWKVVRNLKEINSSDWDSQPSISSDGRELYFISTRRGAKGGDGDCDIYVSTRLGSGKWSKPKNLGSPINTSRREDSPFILPGSDALYFSSGRTGGFGGLDFYVSRRNADGSWGDPENLGSPINTSRDERFITLPASGDVVYFASERRDIMKGGGLLDIFVGRMPPRVTTSLIVGRIFDRLTMVNIPTDLMFVDSATGETLYGVTTSEINGTYSLVLNGNEFSTVEVYGVATGYGPIRATIHIPKAQSYIEIRQDFPLNANVAAVEEASATTGNSPAIRAIPNPATDQVTIDISPDLLATGGNELEVIDAYGNQVQRADITALRLVLDLRELPNGVYLARIGQKATVFVVRR
jgi:hypothetical protein